MWTEELEPVALERGDAYQLWPEGTEVCRVEPREEYVIGHAPIMGPGMPRRPLDFPQRTKGLDVMRDGCFNRQDSACKIKRTRFHLAHPLLAFPRTFLDFRQRIADGITAF
jgi:hypothetical protein